MKPEIGIPHDTRIEIANKLAHFLADSHSLYFTTHSYHWNVTGPHFHALHELFGTQYTELWNALDEIAERIRSLGELAPLNLDALTGLATLPQAEGVPDAEGMIRHLLTGHEHVAKTGRVIIGLAADVHDDATADLTTQRVQIHEKTAWMLRSMLG